MVDVGLECWFLSDSSEIRIDVVQLCVWGCGSCSSSSVLVHVLRIALLSAFRGSDFTAIFGCKLLL